MAKNTETNVNGFSEEGFENENVGFPPYLKIQEGLKFRAIVVALQPAEGEDSFDRWYLQATHDIACYRGPSDEAEEEIVHKGDHFSMSKYAGLPLEQYIGLEVIVEVKGQRDIKGGKTMWVFGLKVRNEDKKLLASRREEALKQLPEGMR